MATLCRSTPFASFPPDTAKQLEAMLVVCILSLEAMTWDVVSNAFQDFTMLTRHRIRLPTVVYFVSRYTTLAFLIAGVLYLTVPLEHCTGGAYLAGSLFGISASSTALLFFFRVTAVYMRTPLHAIVFIIFGILWLSVVGSTFLVLPGMTPEQAGDSDICTFSSVAHYVGLTHIFIFVYDTCVLVAISGRLLNGSSLSDIRRNSWKCILRSIICGSHLPAFSKALLRDGQRYYFCTVAFNLIAVCIFYIPVVPSGFPTIIAPFTTGLTNSMACAVFRKTFQGAITDEEGLPAPVSMVMFGRMGPGGTTFTTMMTSVVAESVSPESASASTETTLPNDSEGTNGENRRQGGRVV